jgi:hypothetical protein
VYDVINSENKKYVKDFNLKIKVDEYKGPNKKPVEKKETKKYEEITEAPVEKDEEEELYFQEEDDTGVNLSKQYEELFNRGKMINEGLIDKEFMDDFVKYYYEYIDNFSKVYQDKNKINNEKAKLKKRFSDEDIKKTMLNKIKNYKKSMKAPKEKPIEKSEAEIQREHEAKETRRLLTNESNVSKTSSNKSTKKKPMTVKKNKR